VSAVAIVTELDPDDDDAQAATRAILGAYLGPSRSVGSVRRRASATRSGWHVEEIDAVLDDGTILELELKDMAPASRSPASRSHTPAFVFNPLREIVVYDELLYAGAFGTPTFYGARVDPMVGRYWVLLGRLGGRSLGEPLIHRDGISATAEAERERWHAAVRRLARFHACYATRVRRSRAGEGSLIRFDDAYYLRWIRRARAFADWGAPDRRRALDHVLDRYERVVDGLMCLPTTLLHGGLVPSNVLVQADGEAGRVTAIDWGMAAIGPGTIDLATLLAGAPDDWTEDDRTAVARTYFESHVELRSWNWQEFRWALDLCRIHTIVQRFGWAPGSVPLPGIGDVALVEAVSLADRLSM